MTPRSTPHPRSDFEMVEMTVTVPPEVMEYVKSRYKTVFGNPNPNQHQIKKYTDQAIDWRFETEDGRDLVEAIGEACEQDMVHIECPDCGHWQSEERERSPEAMSRISRAEKIDGFLLCEECDSLFEDPEGVV